MTEKRLSPSWSPQGGDCYTWFAIDKFGKLAMMSNNGFGYLPKSLLVQNGIEDLLNDLSDYFYEESEKYTQGLRKNGAIDLHLYSSWIYRGRESKNEVLQEILNDWQSIGQISDANLSINKGIFVFEALDFGTMPDEFPVGYSGKCENGDYYKHLAPTIFSSIEDIPLELRRAFVKSEIVDFSKIDIIQSKSIQKFFS